MPAIDVIQKNLEVRELDVKEEKDKKVEETSEESENSPFSEKDLLEVWDILKTEKVNEGKNQEITLLSQEIKLNDTEVTIKILNDVQEILFDKIKTDLTTYLRKALKNSKLTVVIERQAKDSTKMIYTNKEKFDYLAEDNPQLITFKKELGLDTDF